MRKHAPRLKRKRESALASVATGAGALVFLLNMTSGGALALGEALTALVCAALVAPMLCAFLGWILQRETGSAAWVLIPLTALAVLFPLVATPQFVLAAPATVRGQLAVAAGLQFGFLVAGSIAAAKGLFVSPTPARACLNCGYDLAGLSADAPCPECGDGR